jgi:predicted TIM-barrel fold metal-dependent hydrolase
MEKLTYPDIFDVHTHIYPEKIAAKALTHIGNYYNIPIHCKGTAKDLLIFGTQAGISKFVISSVATTPEQVPAINNFMASVASGDSRFIGFGTIHPNFPNPEKEIQRIISLGLKGIKLHPDCQKFHIDTARMLPIYEKLEGKLPILFHVGDSRTDYSSPQRLAEILDKFPGLTCIAAHLGGYRVWETQGHILIGKNLYLDTSSALMFLDRQKALSAIRKHGVDKVLFGTDYPVWSRKEELQHFFELGLSEEEKYKILYSNAKKLFYKDM